MAKILITGASGLLGRALVNAFTKNSWNVLGLAFSRAGDRFLKVDLNDTAAVQRIIQEFKPDVIVHSAAERSPDKVEKEYEASRKLNVTCSMNLAKFADKQNAVFIYISTDYVFDGSNPPYVETDEPNPLNRYGFTKLEGEREVLKMKSDSCILRIPLLYGDEEYIGESAISCLIKTLLNKAPTLVSDYEIRYPSHTSDIANICVKIAEKKLKESVIESTFHWCGLEAFTKYEMTKIIAEAFCLPFSHIIADNNPSSGAPRPKNTQLSCERLRALGIAEHTAFREGVASSFHNFLKNL